MCLEAYCIGDALECFFSFVDPHGKYLYEVRNEVLPVDGWRPVTFNKKEWVELARSCGPEDFVRDRDQQGTRSDLLARTTVDAAPPPLSSHSSSDAARLCALPALPITLQLGNATTTSYSRSRVAPTASVIRQSARRQNRDVRRRSSLASYAACSVRTEATASASKCLPSPPSAHGHPAAGSSSSEVTWCPASNAKCSFHPERQQRKSTLCTEQPVMRRAMRAIKQRTFAHVGRNGSGAGGRLRRVRHLERGATIAVEFTASHNLYNSFRTTCGVRPS